MTPIPPRLARPALALALAAMAAGAVAQAPAAAPAPPEVAAIRKTLTEKFPGAEIRSITKTNYLGGLYEVQFDDRLIYTDAKVGQVLIGAVYDVATRTT